MSQQYNINSGLGTFILEGFILFIQKQIFNCLFFLCIVAIIFIVCNNSFLSNFVKKLCTPFLTTKKDGSIEKYSLLVMGSLLAMFISSGFYLLFKNDFSYSELLKFSEVLIFSVSFILIVLKFYSQILAFSISLAKSGVLVLLALFSFFYFPFGAFVGLVFLSLILLFSAWYCEKQGETLIDDAKNVSRFIFDNISSFATFTFLSAFIQSFAFNSIAKLFATIKLPPSLYLIEYALLAFCIFVIFWLVCFITLISCQFASAFYFNYQINRQDCLDKSLEAVRSTLKEYSAYCLKYSIVQTFLAFLKTLLENYRASQKSKGNSAPTFPELILKIVIFFADAFLGLIQLNKETEIVIRTSGKKPVSISESTFEKFGLVLRFLDGCNFVLSLIYALFLAIFITKPKVIFDSFDFVNVLKYNSFKIFGNYCDFSSIFAFFFVLSAFTLIKFIFMAYLNRLEFKNKINLSKTESDDIDSENIAIIEPFK
jgi:hypothetical protein